MYGYLVVENPRNPEWDIYIMLYIYNPTEKPGPTPYPTYDWAFCYPTYWGEQASKTALKICLKLQKNGLLDYRKHPGNHGV